MPVYKTLAGLLRGPVGNNLDNDLQDVENLKRNFSLEGRYQRPVENGYIDRELDESIWSFQKDYGLKQDGRANPGGETEATLIGVLRGYEPPKNERKNKSVIDANVAHPVIGNRMEQMMLGGGGAISAAEAWRKWQSATTDEREQTLRELNDAEEKGDNEKRCKKILDVQTRICDQIYLTKGSQAARICQSNAMGVYSRCLTGAPEDQWPPFNY